jgi:hypothetical protein
VDERSSRLLVEREAVLSRDGDCVQVRVLINPSELCQPMPSLEKMSGLSSTATARRASVMVRV